MASQTGSDFDQPFDYFISYDRFDQDGYVWDARNDPGRPFINYNYDTANPANVQFTTGGVTPDIRITTNRVFNQLRTYATDFDLDLTSDLTLRFGGMLKHYNFKSDGETRLFGNNQTDLTRFNFVNFAAAVPNLAAVSMVLDGWGEGLEM